MKIIDIQNKLKTFNPKSAWKKGVKTYALEIVEEYISGGAWNGVEITDVRQVLDYTYTKDEKLLNIVRTMSEGGSFLIYNEDIAERLCTRSELLHATHKDGSLREHANARESWLDVQSRAVYQAACMIRRVIAGYSY